MTRPLQIAAFIVTTIVLAACSGGDSTKKTSSSSKAPGTGQTKEPVDKEVRAGIDFHALDFVPYLPGGESFGSGDMMLIEAGYFDVRQSGAKDSSGSIRDYRRATVAAWGGKNAPAVITKSGCAEGKLFPAVSTNALTDTEISGFYSGTLKKDGNQLNAQAEADSDKYDLTAAMEVSATLNSQALSVAGRKIPARGALSLSKALYSIFGTHMDLADLNETLTNTKRELVFTEDSEDETKDFNAVVVTAFGSGNSFIRCLFGPGESATLSNEQIKSLIPLRALTVVYSNVEIVKDGAVPVWVATFGGVGIEDLRVP